MVAPAAPAGQSDTAVASPIDAPAAEAPAAALTISQIHQLLESSGNHQLARQVYDDLKLLELEPGLLVYAPVPALDGDFARRLGEALLNQTGSRWQVRTGEGSGRPSLGQMRSEEHTSELQSLMRHSYAVFCLKNKNN